MIKATIFFTCLMGSIVSSTLQKTLASEKIISDTNSKAKADTSIKQKIDEEASRNVLLNASTNEGPRQISIGLPILNPGDITIVENDLPVVYAYFPHFPSSAWRADGSFSRISLMKLSDVLMSLGRVGYGTSSYTKLGTDKFESVVNYRTNHYGLQQFDITASGPIAKNWFYSVNTYQNFDPGTFKIPYAKYNDRTALYKASLTKRFNKNKGDISLLYKYVNSYNLGSINYVSPFVYDGGGKVSELNGIKFGVQNYTPIDGKVDFIDVRNGKLYKNQAFQDLAPNKSHDINALLHYNFNNDYKFKMSVKWSYADANILQLANMGISNPDPAKTYTYLDPSSGQMVPYTGFVQQRRFFLQSGSVNDVMMMAELSKKSGNHLWKVGINDWFYHVNYWGNSTDMYQQVQANPQKLFVDGQQYFNFNGAGEYIRGFENRIGIMASDEWQVLHNLKLFGGVRLEYLRIQGYNLPYNRLGGFYLGSNLTAATNYPQQTVYPAGTIANELPFSKDYILPSASFSANYNILKNFGLLGEVSFSMQGNKMSDFAGAAQPRTTAPSLIPFGRAGIFFNHPIISVVTAFTYLQKTNTTSRISTSYPGFDGRLDPIFAVFDIQTLGWTFDFILKPVVKGLELHFLAQYQHPTYQNFNITPTANGTIIGNSASFNGNIATGIPEWTLEIDPSYKPIEALRIWASFRYYSRQYGSYNNIIYFNPRWETFAGIDWQINKNFMLGVNVINMFNLAGITGNVPNTEFLTDATSTNGYPTVGSYIRPFTFEVKAQIKL